jgi:F-type H+-transporting ATPase subunit a
VPTDPRPAIEAGEPAATETVPETEAATAPRRSNRRRNIVLLVLAVIVLDIAAAIVVPPFPKGSPGEPISGIGDLILANLEFPAPEIVWPAPHEGEVVHPPMIDASVSITNSLFTMWLVEALLLIVFFVAGRGMKAVPGRLQNAVEYAWESLENWAVSLGGPDARRHVPLFAAFFLLILFSNWSGLLPIFGRLQGPLAIGDTSAHLSLRAPTSDVNVTIGLALVVFIYFNYQGFRRLGVRGYLGKFFVLSGFKHGPANGLIDLFVGLIELLLEFVKPVTLAMRLFGNIFGGEVALGVITALTIALIPAGMLLLEGLLNFVQALIFSTLMLMYTIIAVESHGEEEHAAPAFADEPEGNVGPPLASMQAGSH